MDIPGRCTFSITIPCRSTCSQETRTFTKSPSSRNTQSSALVFDSRRMDLRASGQPLSVEARLETAPWAVAGCGGGSAAVRSRIQHFHFIPHEELIIRIAGRQIYLADLRMHFDAQVAILKSRTAEYGELLGMVPGIAGQPDLASGHDAGPTFFFVGF